MGRLIVTVQPMKFQVGPDMTLEEYKGMHPDEWAEFFQDRITDRLAHDTEYVIEWEGR